MLTWLLITVLIFFGFGEGVLWMRDSVELSCLRSNNSLLERGAEGPLQRCGAEVNDGR